MNRHFRWKSYSLDLGMILQHTIGQHEYILDNNLYKLLKLDCNLYTEDSQVGIFYLSLRNIFVHIQHNHYWDWNSGN